MLPVKFILKKSVSSAFYCRQYAMIYCLKRSFCASVATSEVTEKPKLPNGRKYKSFFGENPDSKDVVLKFFNNCDHVTLNKLISYKVTLFKNYSFHEYMTPNGNDRFVDIEDFLKKSGVRKLKLEDMAKAILAYEAVENTNTGMKFFYPMLEWNTILNADKVVVLDVFHRDFAWCVRNTEDGYITDIGFKKINLKDAYDHLAHHNQIRMFLETIPESEVYLLRTSSARNKIVSKQGSRYAVHQAVVECLIITLLNERHQPTSLTEALPNSDAENTSSEGGTCNGRGLENRVYLFEPAALKDFYEVTFQKELMAVSDLFKTWYLQKHPNIVKWGLNTEERKNLFLNRGAGQVSVCALITVGISQQFNTCKMEITKFNLGVEVRGFRLTEQISFSDELVEKIKKLVHDHRIVVFRDQGEVTGEKQVEISRWFGIIDGTVFEGDPLFSHPKCPHPDVHRISNDPKEGCTNAGRSGWHIDGSFVKEPFGYALYHMPAVPKTGATEFIGFKELLESIPTEMRKSWERLWMVSDKGDKLVHPLVYSHPVTGEPVMCIHLGMTEAFIWDKDTPDERRTDPEETKKLLEEIRNEIEKDGRRLVYPHEWKDGDFVITDNLAVGHFASANAIRPRSEVGLRILHRTTIKGISRPTKG